MLAATFQLKEQMMVLYLILCKSK